MKIFRLVNAQMVTSGCGLMNILLIPHLRDVSLTQFVPKITIGMKKNSNAGQLLMKLLPVAHYSHGTDREIGAIMKLMSYVQTNLSKLIVN